MAKRKPTDPASETNPGTDETLDPSSEAGGDEATDADPGDEAAPAAAHDHAAPPRRAIVTLLRNGPTTTQHNATVRQVRKDGTATLEVEFANDEVVAYDLPRAGVRGVPGTWTPA